MRCWERLQSAVRRQHDGNDVMFAVWVISGKAVGRADLVRRIALQATSGHHVVATVRSCSTFIGPSATRLCSAVSSTGFMTPPPCGGRHVSTTTHP
jgi:hypothetical protein